MLTAKTEEAERDRDVEVVLFIDDYLIEHRYAPSIREVGERFGLSSSDTVYKWLARLRDRGLVDWVDGQPRTLVTVRS